MLLRSTCVSTSGFRASTFALKFTLIATGAFALVSPIFSQSTLTTTQAVDPGIRKGAAGAGGFLPGLTAAEAAQALRSKDVFEEVDSVSGTIPGEEGKGLGPTFNHNSCGGCHAFPAVGGASPAVNPQVAIANLHGATNRVPSFIKLDGPIREARFVKNPDGTPDGGVHGLFTIAGRSDAPTGCRVPQTDFETQVSKGNVIFRIPTPTFGLGLIESIEDSTILANRDASSLLKSAFGISGKANRNGNDGTITRFGWKAQNKSLAIFAGEAYAVEQGVTNDLFPNAREAGTGCTALGHPEDHSDFDNAGQGDIGIFAMFMKVLAAPTPVTSYGNVTATSIQRGRAAFDLVGCILCHTESLTSGKSMMDALTNQQVRLFSDLLVHNMGPRLADGVSQGLANGNEFRTAPLWGLGQRIFLLHDGRTTDLLEAIRSHGGNGSEADASSNAFRVLPESTKQDLLNFLRSL